MKSVGKKTCVSKAEDLTVSICSIFSYPSGHCIGFVSFELHMRLALVETDFCCHANAWAIPASRIKFSVGYTQGELRTMLGDEEPRDNLNNLAIVQVE